MLVDECFERFEMILECFLSLWGGGKRSVGLPTEELFAGRDIADVLQGAQMSDQVAVGHAQQGFERHEIYRIVYGQHRHDAQPYLAFQRLIDLLQVHRCGFVVRKNIP